MASQTAFHLSILCGLTFVMKFVPSFSSEMGVYIHSLTLALDQNQAFGSILQRLKHTFKVKICINLYM